MKIVHVLPALTKGGGEKVAVELANYSVKAGHKVTILAAYPVDPTLLQNSLHPLVDVKFISSRKKRPYSTTFRWLSKNRAWLFQQDILHCHLTYGAFFGTLFRLARNWSKQRRPFVVETYHAVGMAIPAHNRWLHSKLAEHRDALVLMAEDRFWTTFRKSHPRLRTEMIPNGVSITWPEVLPRDKEAYKQKLGISADCRYVIGTVGMLRSDRQPWRYIPIFKEVAKIMGPDVHFVIAGEGPEKERILSLIEEHQLQGRVHLAGLVLNPSLPFSVMDVYVSLAIGPIAGVSMFEAALSNLPVVAIQLMEGYRVKPTDWVWSSTRDQEVALKLVELLQQPEKRLFLAKEQRDYVQKFHSTEAMAAAYEDLYLSLTGCPEKKEQPVSLPV